MSQQPSAVDSLREGAASAAQTVSDTVSPADPNYDPNQDKTNFTKDVHGNTMKKGDYKDQLSEAAMGNDEGKEEAGIVEKVLSYIPGMNKSQQSAFEQGVPKGEEKKALPARPDHDVQVEQFLRKQYHSQSGDGMPDPDKD